VWDERVEMLRPYHVDAAMLRATGDPDVRFMHGLPASHDLETETGRRLHQRCGLSAMEVTDEVFESPASVVFDQAENQMHTNEAVLVARLGHEASLGDGAASAGHGR
jgi:ornithine carbamoyltransferase